MTVAIIMDNRYLEHDPGGGHPESPSRLRVIYDLIEQKYGSLPLIPPRLATESELALVHDPFYIQTVANTEGRPSSHLDADTGLSPRSYEIARLAAGGLLEAVDKVLMTRNPGSLTPASVFAFVRPPGHHAEPDRGMGFCLFNNVAIAAEYAKGKYGLKRILIVDWDLHHGNGTQKAFYEDPGVLFFSSHQYPYYPGSGNFNETGSGRGEGFTVNAPLPTGFGDDEYINLYAKILRPLALEYQPELVLVSAGFDPYFKDPLGGMKVTPTGFGALADIVRDIALTTCTGRVVLSLEGGYHPDGLRDGVSAVLQSLMDRSHWSGEIKPSPAAEQIIRQITLVQRKFWKNLR
jgi:acetoin utilization deacetylase AcuC-like enzyme